MNLLGYRETQLPNGLTILTDYLPPEILRPRVEASLYVWSGSWHDPQDKIGVAHALEHMLVNRSTQKLETSEIRRFSDETGSYFGAETSRMYTRFKLSTLDDVLFETLEMLLEQVLQPALKQEEFSSEKSAIVEEVREAKDNLDTYSYLLANSILLGRNPFHIWGTGSIDDITRLSVDDIYAFRKTHYIPENMTLLVQGTFVYTTGDIEERIDRFHREITERVAEYFEKVFDATVPVEKPYPTSPKLAIKDSVFAHEEISWLNNMYFVWGRNIPNSRKDSHKKFLSTIVLLSILNRKVREELRDKKGLTYSANYSYTPFPREDYFGFDISCSPEKIPRIIDFIKHIEEDIRINVPLDEFQISRKKRIRSIQDEYAFGTHFIKCIQTINWD